MSSFTEKISVIVHENRYYLLLFLSSDVKTVFLAKPVTVL